MKMKQETNVFPLWVGNFRAQENTVFANNAVTMHLAYKPQDLRLKVVLCLHSVF